MAAPRTYTRTMNGWWRRNPFYVRYMVREASCVFIVAYALVLLAGLAQLAQDRAAYEAWLEGLSRPGPLAFHVITLVLVVYHAWTWFKVMPKTLPFVRFGGRRVPDGAIVAGAVAAGVASSLAVFLVVWWWRP